MLEMFRFALRAGRLPVPRHVGVDRRRRRTPFASSTRSTASTRSRRAPHRPAPAVVVAADARRGQRVSIEPVVGARAQDASRTSSAIAGRSSNTPRRACWSTPASTDPAHVAERRRVLRARRRHAVARTGRQHVGPRLRAEMRTAVFRAQQTRAAGRRCVRSGRSRDGAPRDASSRVQPFHDRRKRRGLRASSRCRRSTTTPTPAETRRMTAVARDGRAATRGRDRAAEGVPAGHDRAVADVDRGTEGVQRGAAGDQRGAALGVRGTRDQQGGAAVDQRGADDGQRRAEGQGRGDDPDQRRPAEPDRLHRHRGGVRRRAAAHQALHAARDRAVQPDPDRRRPVAARHHATASTGRRSADDATEAFRSLRAIEREARSADGRHYLARVVPYRTIDNRIDGAVDDLRRHDVARRRRAARWARTRSDCGSSRRRVRHYAIITLDERRPRSRPGTRARATRSATTRAKSIGRSIACCSRRRTARAGCPSRSSGRAQDRAAREDERWHLRKDGTRFYCERRHDVVSNAAARWASRRSRAT